AYRRGVVGRGRPPGRWGRLAARPRRGICRRAGALRSRDRGLPRVPAVVAPAGVSLERLAGRLRSRAHALETPRAVPRTRLLVRGRPRQAGGGYLPVGLRAGRRGTG